MHKFVLQDAIRIGYSSAVASATSPELKTRVAEFWNAEPCGTRYLSGESEFETHAGSRYTLEPHIPAFAKFSESSGLRVLEKPCLESGPALPAEDHIVACSNEMNREGHDFQSCR